MATGGSDADTRHPGMVNTGLLKRILLSSKNIQVVFRRADDDFFLLIIMADKTGLYIHNMIVQMGEPGATTVSVKSVNAAISSTYNDLSTQLFHRMPEADSADILDISPMPVLFYLLLRQLEER